MTTFVAVGWFCYLSLEGWEKLYDPRVKTLHAIEDSMLLIWSVSDMPCVYFHYRDKTCVYQTLDIRFQVQLYNICSLWIIITICCEQAKNIQAVLKKYVGLCVLAGICMYGGIRIKFAGSSYTEQCIVQKTKHAWENVEGVYLINKVTSFIIKSVSFKT